MHNNNRRRRPIDEDSGNFFQGLGWGVVVTSLLFLVVFLAFDEAGRDSYPAPVDAAQQVEDINHG